MGDLQWRCDNEKLSFESIYDILATYLHSLSINEQSVFDNSENKVVKDMIRLLFKGVISSLI